MKKINEICSNKKTSFITVSLYIVSFFILSTLFIVKKSDIFPLLISGITLLVLVIAKQYRVYILFSLMSFFAFFKPINTSIGSYITWLFLAYYIIVIIELAFQKRIKIAFIKYKKILFVYTSFAIISFLVCLFNFSALLPARTVSFLIYLFMPIALMLSIKKDDINFDTLKLIFIISLLTSNIYSFIFCYLFKAYLPNFVEIVCSGFLNDFGQVNTNNFRFCGLMTDPNFNGFLIVSALCLCFGTTSEKNKILLPILTITLIPFGLLGQSKAFIIATVVFFLIFAIRFFAKKKKIILGLSIFLGALCVVLTLSSTSLLFPIVQRLLIIDDRIGFLNGFTTGRANIQINYLSNMLKNPIMLYFGRGLFASDMSSYCPHNTFLAIIWDSGIIGGALLVIFCYFVFSQNTKMLFNKLLFIGFLCFFALSLDLRSYSFIFMLFYLFDSQTNITTNKYFDETISEKENQKEIWRYINVEFEIEEI